jgi:hypothetical protein
MGEGAAPSRSESIRIDAPCGFLASNPSAPVHRAFISMRSSAMNSSGIFEYITAGAGFDAV